jgi:RimJ/RimL family protein N-acetyltransferase
MTPELLRGDGVVLRPLRLDDADDVTAGCRDPETLRYLPHLPSPYTRDDALWWITEGAPARVAAGGGAYAIADPTTDRLLGSCGLQLRGEGTAEIGYWVAPWGRRRSVATATARTLTAHAFASGLERVYLRNEPENVGSQRVALASGFTREGMERGGGANRGGGRHDLLVWARLADDPDGPTRRILPDLPGGELTDGVVTLRPIRPADADDTLAVRSLPEVVATSVPPRAPDRAWIERFCARAEAGWLAGERADLTIRDAATGAYAGEIGLYYFEPPTQQAMIGYSMMPAWRGRGYATRAATLVSRWAFTVGIARVIAGTDPTNIGSQRVLERAGFVREAHERGRLPGIDGTRLDNLLYALLPGPAVR